MKKIITIIAIVFAVFITLISLVTYVDKPDRGIGIDLPLGWMQPENSEITRGAVCAKGTSPYVQGLPFYTGKHDGVLTCEPGMSNNFALFLDILIATGLIGLSVFAIYRLLKRRRQ